MDDLFADAVRQVLAQQCTPRMVRVIEAGGSAQHLWQHIESAGFADALVSEEYAGAGLSLPDVFTVFELCGRYALPVPLAETMIARSLLADAGLARPLGSIVLAAGAIDPDGNLVCHCVRGGRVADFVLVTAASQAMLLASADASQTEAGFALDAVMRWQDASLAAAPRFTPAHDVQTLQACIFAAQLAGGLMRVFEYTLQYANDRQQFGRPLGKFQAIQHQLAVISEHVFAGRMAAQIGCYSSNSQPDRLRVAVAKARTSEAALEVAAMSHSIHGAIGFTEEFDLQLYTRRLHQWRQAGGSESYWWRVAGEYLIAHGSSALDSIRVVTDNADGASR